MHEVVAAEGVAAERGEKMGTSGSAIAAATPSSLHARGRHARRRTVDAVAEAAPAGLRRVPRARRAALRVGDGGADVAVRVPAEALRARLRAEHGGAGHRRAAQLVAHDSREVRGVDHRVPEVALWSGKRPT